ncbi:PfkB family carbohydrate kinase [Parenemella sanctibonifatiensis]|uniref:pyridoxal kinase n=1 Tax=Parenemella sanctibonifatiensis TaxID=2016505 RepID=A0A255E7N9_9ACTN|nr:PfkB family carbohydrate kinase [Parenemella sanctibonifatiensis]OYN87554.1 bifunctional hydroxymethylpyrimidine kinase/phosphomethylpyrimidine kinase [Parenemella sanctibonifatiensis]OYN89040.1 bifunctional hydroxymethylpyrimidine kinase/phosphomethylpyrimidine kinase [Parenemella sanctibonifatiensis]
MTQPFLVQRRRDTPAGVALTIAGNEASGGAGAAVDLKTFHSYDVFGAAAITCLVSVDPNNDWAHRFVPVDPQVIADQIEATLSNYTVDTVKIGMLGTPATIEVVADALQGELASSVRNIVLDPVLLCKGQESPTLQATDDALREAILPLSTVVTPNHFETEALSGMTVTDLDGLIAAAKKINEISGAAVLAKGGVRLAGPDAVDVFVDGDVVEVLQSPKVGEDAIHGAGCTVAAAVTAELARGASAVDAARSAKAFVDAGILAAVRGNRPFDVVWQGV